jgi:hypothetical protein
MIRHFVSYPKSGRTWIRYILVQLDCEPSVSFHHDHFEFNDGARPAHDFGFARRVERYRQVDRLVYLERDPRDVMVSLYFQVTGRFRDFFGYRGSLSEFIRDDYFGAHNLHRFRSMWAALCARLGFHRVSYEACHADMENAIAGLLAYYGFEVEPARVREAVANASFGQMQQLEQSEGFAQPWLRPRQGALKVRRGKVGGFRDTLGADDIAYLDGVFGREADGPAS